MNYTEARAYLDEMAKHGSVLGLESMKVLLAELGDPQDQLKFVHICGTNGKGSALAYLSTVLKEAGYRTGRYISPTLFSYRERIQVNEEYIQKESLAFHVTQIKAAIGRMREKGVAQPTIFEIETALAFLYFVEQKCDIVVLETGMGGDTDATNVIKTGVLEVLMPVSMDHMEFLGDTLAKIAAHKAGIIKPGTVVVSAAQEEEAMQVIREAAVRQNAALFVAQPERIRDIVYGLQEQSFSYKTHEHLVIHLAGTYQIENAATAVEAIEALQRIGYSISEEQLRSGLQKTVWRGRFSVLMEKPLFIMDGAHNRAGAKELRSSIETYLKGRRLIAICGVFRDKEYEEILKAAAPYVAVMLTIQTPDNPRALPAEELAEAARKYIPCVTAVPSIAEAVDRACKMADGEKDAILAFGSLAFLGEIAKAAEKKRG